MSKKITKKTAQTKKKTKAFKPTFNFYVYLLLGACAALLLAFGIKIKITETEAGEVVIAPETHLVISDDPVPAMIENDKGEVEENYEIPTIEEVDGGLFEDKDTGVSITDDEYSDLGWSEYYNTSSPEAFKLDTLNKCIYANNVYGAQCVSLARVFWWSYADRDVSTCGTGMAKGMMNCKDQNAGDDFLVFDADDKDEIQAGDWLVFTGGQYGHVGMALGHVSNGYVALLGENQGGHYCEGGGAATNIININIKNLIGFYRPKAYVKPEPTPEPETDTVDTYTVKKGDTLGAIVRKLGWYEGDKLFGDDGYCQILAEYNGIENRGLIYPNQVIKRK